MGVLTGAGAAYSAQLNAIAFSKTDVATIFEKAALLNSNLAMNEFGLYQYVQANGDGSVELLGLETPMHILQGRTGDNFIDKGRVNHRRSRTEVYNFELNASQRPTALWGDFFEYLQNPDRPYDFNGSEQFQTILATVLQLVIQSVPSSITEIAYFWNHPDIPAGDQPTYLDVAKTQPNPVVVAAQPASVSSREQWLNYHDQMTYENDSAGFLKSGAISKLDLLASGTVTTQPNQSTLIDASEYTKVGNVNGLPTVRYDGLVGSTGGLFERMTNNALPQLREKVYQSFNSIPVIICVCSEIFRAFTQELAVTGTGVNVRAWAAAALSMGESEVANFDQSVALWNGIPVVRSTELDTFCDHTGVKKLRAMICAAGNFVVASRGGAVGTPLRQSNFLAPAEQSLIIQQAPSIREKGRVDIMMNGSVGAGFADYAMVAYAVSEQIV